MVWGIIGGSAPLDLTEGFTSVETACSRYGPASAPVYRGRLGKREVVFLARHGEPHHIAPHLINYRANVDTLCALGVQGVVALNTVGGISPQAEAGRIFVPQQIVDYTWGRAHTFSDEATLIHADFAEPLDEVLRRGLIGAAETAGVDVTAGGVYGCTQGPRFETAAEIERMERDGCDLVGMTGMPEAALARERELPYAMLSLVVNPAAGRAANPFDLEVIAQVAAAGMERVAQLLTAFIDSDANG
jgi:5'-methylthioinosine phosphorylase